MDWHAHILTDPHVLAGKPIVRGTRLAVDFLLGLFAQGWTESQVLENYPGLSREALLAVFAYAAESIADERVYPLAPGKP